MLHDGTFWCSYIYVYVYSYVSCILHVYTCVILYVYSYITYTHSQTYTCVDLLVDSTYVCLYLYAYAYMSRLHRGSEIYGRRGLRFSSGSSARRLIRGAGEALRQLSSPRASVDVFCRPHKRRAWMSGQFFMEPEVGWTMEAVGSCS